jgi:putative transposase
MSSSTELHELATAAEEAVEAAISPPDMAALAEELVERARTDGVELTGPQGLLTALTRKVLSAALEVEMADHLGYDRHDPVGRGSGNSRNGTTSKSVRTDVGEVRIEVPRDRNGTFDPVVVPKRSRRLAGFDDAVLSLYAKGMTTGDIAAHLADIYGDQVSRSLVSRVTDAVVEDMQAWRSRPLNSVYPVVLLDAIFIKVREGTVANRPVYVAMGIDTDGYRDVLGMWAGPEGGEGAKQWMNMLTDLRNRGVADVCIVCCDGLKGLPEAINAIWPQATVQSCVVHLIRNSLRYASKKDWAAISASLKPIYHAPNPTTARERFDDFAAQWGGKYPAMVAMWDRSWTEFIPFLDFPEEIRRLIYTTNGIESLNARFRKATRRRGHFPNETAAMKVLYLTALERRPNRSNPTGQINGWKSIMNTLAITYGDRLTIN